MIRETAIMLRKMAENLEGMATFALPANDLTISEAIITLSSHASEFHIDLDMVCRSGAVRVEWKLYFPESRTGNSYFDGKTLREAVSKALLALQSEAVTPDIGMVDRALTTPSANQYANAN
jgi:hypothetical protein